MVKTEYFPHEYFAREDEKIERLVDDYGMEGYGAWWAVVEICYQRDGFVYANSLKTIAKKLGVSETLVTDIFTRYSLFYYVSELDGYRSESIMRRLDERKCKSLKARENVTKRWTSGQKYDSNTETVPPYYGRTVDKKIAAVDNNLENDTSVLRPNRNDDTDVPKTAYEGNTIKSNQIDDIYNNYNITSGARTRDEAERGKNRSDLEEACGVKILRESALAVYRSDEVITTVERVILDYLDAKENITVGDVEYEYGDIYKLIKKVQGKTFLQIVSGFYVKSKNKKPYEWALKKIHNPTGYVIASIVKAGEGV